MQKESGPVIYLDNHSAARPCASTLERMKPYLFDHWGAGFAPHRMGQELMAALDSRYQALYDLVGATSDDTCVFTSSGAEAVNQALWSVFLQSAKKEGKCHFIVSSLEDLPTLQMMHRLEEFGCFVKMAPLLPSGQIDVEALSSLISPRTALVSVTMADGLTGVLQPIEEIAQLCREKGALLHLEASYAIGKLSFSFADLGADYLSFSGDRMHALKSSGALFAKAGKPLSPLILGGSEQAGLRGGAFDIPSFMGLAAAAGQSALFLDRMSLETARLRDLFEYELLKRIPKAVSPFADQLRLPNVSVLSFPGAHAEALLYLLNKKGLYASLGGPFSQSLSYLLQLMNIDASLAEASISFSLSRYTTEEEILRAIGLVAEAVSHLHTLSEQVVSCP
ncbi:MAG TPA: aminotransferase class V-fold PLP-dependent enzyme [Parachlamydiales bacterium]|nr:aminotransferase class V-fold PLP-dependent enzyme [Parachlamydiales bacterium]